MAEDDPTRSPEAAREHNERVMEHESSERPPEDRRDDGDAQMADGPKPVEQGSLTGGTGGE